VSDIDSAPDRMCIRVEQGKGAKDRYVPLASDTLHMLPYAHMVFTLPHGLNTLYQSHPRWVMDTLFACSAQTLGEFAANPKWLGGQGAFTLVLHTWTQDLRRHLHVHALVACGALGSAGQWVAPQRKPDFLFPVHALSKVFRGKFMAALQAAHEAGAIAKDPQGANAEWAKRHKALYGHDWVVYAKTPIGGPAQVLEYLARYTHRTAIGNERITSVNSEQVAFRVRADDQGGKRMVQLGGVEFVRRLLLHVLPTGVKRIRHYGLLAPSKTQTLAQARQALRMPMANAHALESAKEFMQRVAKVDAVQCPCCAPGRLRLVETLKGSRTLPAPGAPDNVPPHSTGPP